MKPEPLNARMIATVDYVAFMNEIDNVQADKVNPHFKSRYASLAEVLSTIKKVSVKHHLSYCLITDTQIVQNGDGTHDIYLHLISRFLHDTGEIFEAGRLIYKTSGLLPQPLGSTMTYLRRQAAQAACSISTDVDDDGQSVSQPMPAKPPVAPMPRPVPQDPVYKPQAKPTAGNVKPEAKDLPPF